ncbi:MAG: DUF1501 domain-containing protein, partial [Rhodothermales bacterium]|nr:DUF1501 domain-containing protein [Rhodothermales bacterium]
PEAVDIEDEPEHIKSLYGLDQDETRIYGRQCLMARRLVERGVRFVQLYHTNWDHHGNANSNLGKPLERICAEVDRPSAALVTDLKRRGLLEDTLVIWGGEFGRTAYSQGKLSSTNYGRDHHPRCFSLWMAGGGVAAGTVYGSTDDFGYNVASNPVHVHDFQATLLHLMGFDHERLTYLTQGRRFRLTDVHGEVVPGLLA